MIVRLAAGSPWRDFRAWRRTQPVGRRCTSRPASRIQTVRPRAGRSIPASTVNRGTETYQHAVGPTGRRRRTGGAAGIPRPICSDAAETRATNDMHSLRRHHRAASVDGAPRPVRSVDRGGRAGPTRHKRSPRPPTTDPFRTSPRRHARRRDGPAVCPPTTSPDVLSTSPSTCRPSGWVPSYSPATSPRLRRRP